MSGPNLPGLLYCPLIILKHCSEQVGPARVCWTLKEFYYVQTTVWKCCYYLLWKWGKSFEKVWRQQPAWGVFFINFRLFLRCEGHYRLQYLLADLHCWRLLLKIMHIKLIFKSRAAVSKSVCELSANNNPRNKQFTRTYGNLSKHNISGLWL